MVNHRRYRRCILADVVATVPGCKAKDGRSRRDAASHIESDSLSRPGRKRKLGLRHASGQLIRAKQTHGRTQLSSFNPLGSLRLQKIITAGQFDAGVRYAAIVGTYRATINAPGSRSSNGKGSRCHIEITGQARACKDLQEPDECICLIQRKKYDAAFVALFSAGQLATKAVARVAVFDEQVEPQDIIHLQRGLTALEYHFALT